MSGNVTHQGVVIDRALVADLLTLARLLSAPLLLWLVATSSLDVAVVVLGFAWCTDFFDGRFARSAPRDTILKEWDLRADAWLAVALGTGLGFSGLISWWLLAPVAGVVFVGSVLFSNPAAVMVGTGYLFGVFLWSVMQWGGLWWLPSVYLVLALLANWRRFFWVILPACWQGLVSAAQGKRQRGRSLVLEDWVD
ncbi:MAG: CDP-alcohol phosphatidyltransferase family protein [bacterium]|nr:CDP-alcohol phosphatidyltransferase family protein [bacterium]